MKEVHISPVLNGFVVTVGCTTLVFDSIEKLAEELVRYQKDPKKMEMHYRDNAVNKDYAAQRISEPLHER